MPDQHDRATRRHQREHGFQVLAKLSDGIGVGRGLAGLAVSALVVEHHSNLRAPLLGKSRSLKVKGAHPKTEAMREYHRQPRILGADLTNGEVHSIGRRHHIAAVCVEKIEVLILVGIVGS